jgi:hypothetical protein
MNFLKRSPGATPDITTLLRRPAHRPKAFCKSLAGTGLDSLLSSAVALAIAYGGLAWDLD